MSRGLQKNNLDLLKEDMKCFSKFETIHFPRSGKKLDEPKSKIVVRKWNNIEYSGKKNRKKMKKSNKKNKRMRKKKLKK